MVNLIKYTYSSCTTLVKYDMVFSQVEHVVRMANDL